MNVEISANYRDPQSEPRDYATCRECGREFEPTSVWERTCLGCQGRPNNDDEPEEQDHDAA